jgi:hypothetical protein
MGQQQTIGKTATTVLQVNGRLTVTYHDTAVVVADDTTIILDTGGWFTATTKTRMNQTSAQFGLGFKVYQKRGEWFVDTNGTTIPFVGDFARFPAQSGESS